MDNFIDLNELLQNVDWNTVTDSVGFDDLPEGYYLCEVETAELKMNKAMTNQQVSFKFKVVETGIKDELDARGHSVLVEIPGTKNRKIFKHYPFKDINSVKRFVTDMLKFEGDDPGVPLLEKEYFMTAEIIPDALDILIGRRIYIQATYKEYNGQKNCWYDIISWTRAKEMGLPTSRYE